MRIRLVVKIFCLLAVFLNVNQAIGQNKPLVIEKQVFDSFDATHGYYLEVKPKSKEILGVLLLMPGFGQKAEDVFRDTKFHHFASERGLLTIAFSTHMRMFADTFMQGRLNQVLTRVKTEHKIPADKFVLGGFSAGGSIILRYVELCKQFPEKFPINPAAAFMVDSPIDVFHSWNMMQELKVAANSQVAIDEANWVEKMYIKNYGTTPCQDPNTFIPFTSFSMDGKYGNNEEYLKEVAVRAYHDVDVPWRLNNRNQSAQHSNYLVTSELINKLLILGNSKAEFIQSYQTGYRANGDRHPHSWSIVDERECIQWINNLLGNSSLLQDSNPDKENVVPFKIDKKSLSGLNLRRGRNPAQPDRILFFQNIFSGEQLNVQIVSSENASASPENLEIDEFLFLTNGGAQLIPKYQNKEMNFFTGDFFLVPRGYNGEWKTIGAPTYHHEITVTTAQRNESPVNPDKTIPILMNKGKIAGIGITEISPGQYYDLLYQGHELTVVLEGEIPQVREIEEPQFEQVLYIVSGTLSLWDSKGIEYNFVSGDFVVIPNGFTGTWQSKGQELFRTLKIFKSSW